MSATVLQSIMENWGNGVFPGPATSPTEDSQSPHGEPSAVSHAGPKPEVLRRDVARLKDIMRQYPIRPHLHEDGGDGFSHPYTNNWPAEYWDIISEFSALWFSPAGAEIIAQYGHLMRVIPSADRGKPVHVQPWRAGDAIDAKAGPAPEVSP